MAKSNSAIQDGKQHSATQWFFSSEGALYVILPYDYPAAPTFWDFERFPLLLSALFPQSIIFTSSASVFTPSKCHSFPWNHKFDRPVSLVQENSLVLFEKSDWKITILFFFVGKHMPCQSVHLQQTRDSFPPFWDDNLKWSSQDLIWDPDWPKQLRNKKTTVLHWIAE